MTDDAEIQEKQYREICRKLSLLEQHLINMIVPLQEVSKLFKSSEDVKKVMDIVQRPIQVDDRSLAQTIAKFRKYMDELGGFHEVLDLTQALSELKFIGKRVNDLDKKVSELLSKGLHNDVEIRVMMNGKECEERHIQELSEDNEILKKLYETLTPREAETLNFILMSSKEVSLVDISRKIALSYQTTLQHRRRLASKLCAEKRVKVYEKIKNTRILARLESLRNICCGSLQ